MSDPKLDPMLSKPTTPTAPALTAFVDAYNAYKDLIAAVSDDALLHINVDVPAVVTMICGAWPATAAMRSQLATLPHFDAATMQCGAAPIFLAGDVSASRAVLHEASDEGHIAGGNAARFPQVQAQARRVPLQIAFTDPQIAVVGDGGAALRRGPVEVGEVSYADQGRARVIGKNAGLVRIYAGREGGELLGAEMFGPGVEHTAHLLAWAVQSGVDVQRALQMPFYHPVLEEGIRTALRDLAARLEHRAPPRALEMECGPGT